MATAVTAPKSLRTQLRLEAADAVQFPVTAAPSRCILHARWSYADRPSRLWKDMPVDKRVAAADAFWRDDEASGDRSPARRGHRHDRAPAELPAEERARRCRSSVARNSSRRSATSPTRSRRARSSRITSRRSVRSWRRSSTRSGIAHENGLITEEEVAAPDRDRLAAAVEAVRETHPADDVELYLRTLAALDGDTWVNLDAAHRGISLTSRQLRVVPDLLFRPPVSRGRLMLVDMDRTWLRRAVAVVAAVVGVGAWSRSPRRSRPPQGPTLDAARPGASDRRPAHRRAAPRSPPRTPTPDLERIKTVAQPRSCAEDRRNKLVFYRRRSSRKLPTFREFIGDYDLMNGPTRGGNPMTHQEFLNMVTPKEMYGSGGIRPTEMLQFALVNWLGQALIKKGARRASAKRANDEIEIAADPRADRSRAGRARAKSDEDK